MEWTSDTFGQQYTTTQGRCQGVVWQEAPGGAWRGLVRRDGAVVDLALFSAVEDAWAWCEAQLAARVAAGLCSCD